MDKKDQRILTRAQNIGVGVTILFVALTAGLYLGQAGSSSLTTLSGDSQLAAVGTNNLFSKGIFDCLGSEITITAQNNSLAKAVIVPALGKSGCSALLPDYIDDTHPLDFLKGGVVTSGSFYGRDGEEYTTKALAHSNLLTNATYPRGFYKFYFRDPSVTGSEVPDGKMTLRVLFHTLPSVKVRTAKISSTSIVGIDSNGQPIMADVSSSDGYHVSSSQRPFISFTYSVALVNSGTKVLERVWSFDDKKLLTEKVITAASSGNVFSYNPASVSPGKTFITAICPLKNEISKTPDGKCLFKIFTAVEEVSSSSSGVKNVKSSGGSNCRVPFSVSLPAGLPTTEIKNPDETECNTGHPGQGGGTTVIGLSATNTLICTQGGGPYLLDGTEDGRRIIPQDVKQLDAFMPSHLKTISIPEFPSYKPVAYTLFVPSYPKGTGTANFEALFPKRAKLQIWGKITKRGDKIVDSITGLDTVNGPATFYMEGTAGDLKGCKGQTVPLVLNQTGGFVGYRVEGKDINFLNKVSAGFGVVENGGVKILMQIPKLIGKPATDQVIGKATVKPTFNSGLRVEITETEIVYK